MRGILYRGFHLNETGSQKVFVNGKWIHGKWLYGCFCQHTSFDIMNIHKPYPTMNGYLAALNFWDVILETVGQYTGLTDKNGKKIFEGDIIKRTWGEREIYKVVYDDSSAGFLGLRNCGFTTFGCGRSFEIIGNIYDNPEMIK